MNPEPTLSSKTVKLIIGGFGAIFIGIMALPIEQIRYIYSGGLFMAAFILFLLFAFETAVAKPGGETLADKAIWLVPEFGFIGILFWYAGICYHNKESIKEGTMPENWTMYGWIIYVLLLVQLAVVVYGGKYACFSWLTMSFLAVFVVMQFIVAENFRTSG